MRKVLFVLLVLLLSAALWPQDASQPQELQQQSSTISGMLQKLKRESDEITTRLDETLRSLETSETERQRLEELSTSLSSSLKSINEELTDSYATIRILSKVLKVLVIVLLVMTAGKIAGYILYAKGIKLPRWLDILL